MMKRTSKIRTIQSLLLIVVACCLVSSAAAWVYQVKKTFIAGTEHSTVPAGETAHFRLWQSDGLAAAFGHACYLEPQVSVEGLPAGSEVSGVNWLNCHESSLSIATQPTIPPGIYRLTIKRVDAIAFPIRVTLEIVEP
jgi:hypothetical protein